MQKIKHSAWVLFALLALAAMGSCGTQKAATRTHDRGGCNCGF
ncbi:MAG: hypothetical protein O3C22_05420 [Bacteroidetes bacterium]|nr:hypothetical protein [Bacteroidota bacterium]MDA0943521.1 hypothetical protein [Bacteroidota bacterium]MDA1112144.1 hypothetical protein [Bacteroidota bacterium]